MKKLFLLFTMLVQVSIVFSQTHFVKGFLGNGYEQMNLNIVDAKIGTVKLQAGDEIAVFDGVLCVGVILLTQEVESAEGPTKYIPILTASAEELTNGVSDYAGFKEGNKMYLRFWDQSANKEYFNINLTFVDQTTGNPTTPKTFTKATTYFVRAETGNTDRTWVSDTNGGSANSWGDADSWDPAGMPEPKDNVTIPTGITQPSIGTGVGAFAGSLTFTGTTSLSFVSNASSTGSLIVATDVTGSPTVTFRRYVLFDGWHMVSSPLSGQTIGGFLTANAGIATKAPSRGMMDYDELANDWSTYFTNGNSNAISAGRGYSVRRESTAGAIAFTGSLINGNVSVSLAKGNKGWNLIGNPFASAIYVKQEVFGFLVQNDAILDPSFKGIYLWDPTANAGSGAYTVVNKTEGQSNLASAQGFFVKAASAGSVLFTKQMQVNQMDAPFKSATVQIPSVVLNARSNDISSSTKVLFSGETTLGLDPGYDAGILRSGNGFDIYSKLVADNGVDFMVQALPGKSTDKYIIPVGVDVTKGGEIVFSANSFNLPDGYQVLIQDKLTNSFTELKNGELYVANLTANSKGTGRFYLHVGAALQTGINEVNNDKLVVYTSDNKVYIKGDVGINARFTVYSVDGRVINRFEATSQNLNQVSVSGYTPGIYFISVQSTMKYKPVKFVVGK